MSSWVWIAVALVGGFGACARSLVDSLVSAHARNDFPFGTLAVNASGSLLLGLLAGLAVGGNLLVLAGTATLGSYTTFSTWMLETERLADDGRHLAAFVNVLVSLAVGVSAVALGRAIGVHL